MKPQTVRRQVVKAFFLPCDCTVVEFDDGDREMGSGKMSCEFHGPLKWWLK